MANPYSSVSISGYNSSPPPDDGSNTAANEIKWATHKNKIGDPLKTALESINANVSSAFGKMAFNGVTTTGVDYTVLTSDQGKLVSCTNTITITLPSAATVGTPFSVAIKNAGSGTVTVDGNASETIDGDTTYSLAPGSGIVLLTDGSNWHIGASLGSGVPVGAVTPYAGSTAPNGWLLCDGSAVSRTTYAGLFTAISTTYGEGDASTTFNVPDLRGRVVAGQDDMGGTSANRLTDQTGGVDGDVLGDTGGAETHTLLKAELPSYNLVFPGSPTQSAAGIAAGTALYTNAGTTDVPSGGSGTPLNIVQPTIILNYIIKT